MKSVQKTLTAEMLSFRTGRTIGHFADLAPRETGLPLDHIVKDNAEIDEAKVAARQPPRSPPKEGGGSKEKLKPRKSGGGGKKPDSRVESALEKIGGILTVLDPGQRNAVLKRINGAFHYSPKVKAEEPVPKAAPKEKPREKSSFNESFFNTAPGQMLAITSKVMSSSAKKSSVEERPSEGVYALHRSLLKVRSEAKASDTLPPKLPVTDPKELSDLIPRVVTCCTAIHAHLLDHEQEIPPLQVLELGWCLSNGETPSDDIIPAGFDPAPGSWEKVSLTVQRTAEEQEKRNIRLVELKELRKSRKRKGEEVIDPSRPPPGISKVAAASGEQEIQETLEGPDSDAVEMES